MGTGVDAEGVVALVREIRCWVDAWLVGSVGVGHVEVEELLEFFGIEHLCFGGKFRAILTLK